MLEAESELAVTGAAKELLQELGFQHGQRRVRLPFWADSMLEVSEHVSNEFGVDEV